MPCHHTITLVATAITLSIGIAGCSSPSTPNNAPPPEAIADYGLSAIVAESLSEQNDSTRHLAEITQPRPVSPAIEHAQLATPLATDQGYPNRQATQLTDRKLEMHLSPQQYDKQKIASVLPSTTANHLGARKLPKKSDALIQEPNTEKYQVIDAPSIISVAKEATSTFSIDVDTGAYSNVRRFLNTGTLPPANAVRIEEMLNYFTYDYETPANTDTPFSINTEVAVAPWNKQLRLLHIGLKGYEIDKEQRPAANLVFLLDVSGSMNKPNKLGLLKSSIKMMTKNLNDTDKVSIVVYAGASGIVLEPTAGNDYRTIAKALDSLSAGGSTNGQAGIEQAYAMAEKNLDPEGINRVILATDGDFNVGISNIEQLKSLIEKKRESGIALSTLGFGTGNYNDHLMEQLADTGNGAYAYIDTLKEAQKVLSEELTATLMTIAKDVKIQIEFNPAVVSEYRLIGYVNRTLANEDFNNDKVDAGEIGAGHTVTALYEIALHDEGGGRNSPIRYGNTSGKRADNKSADTQKLNEIAELRLRYKQPKEGTSQLISKVITTDNMIDALADTSDNYRFSAAIAGFGQLLGNDKYLNDFNYADASRIANSAKGNDPFGYRSEFIQLVKLADSLDPDFRTAKSPGLDENEG